jgi:hypothetical protein
MSDDSRSDFLDIYSPIVIAGMLTVAVFLAVLIAIQQWESSRYGNDLVS